MINRLQSNKRFLLPLSFALLAGLATAFSPQAADTSRGPEAAAQGMAKVLSASGFSFGRMVLRADLPVIVDFWAPWCIACRELDGPLSDVAAKFAGRVRVVRVNVNWSASVAHRYDVQALPTVLVFKHGALISRLTGGASAQDLEDLLGSASEPAAATSR